MSYEVFRIIFIGGAVLSGLCLATAVLLFFVLRIPSVIGDLTGSTARKGIENIRNKNEDAGVRTVKSSAVNQERGRVTSKMTPSGRLRTGKGQTAGHMATNKIGTNRLLAMAQESAAVSAETTLLTGEGNGTTLLAPANETTVLDGVNETTVLDAGGFVHGGETAAPYGGGAQAGAFAVEYDITFVFSDELAWEEQI